MTRWALPISTLLFGVIIGFALMTAGLGGLGQTLTVMAMAGGSAALMLSWLGSARMTRAGLTPADARVTGDPWQHLHDELRRSRRHGHHFVLARIRVTKGRTSAPQDPAEALRGGQKTLVAVEASLRTTDRCWLDGGSVYALLPETDRSMADTFLERARRAYPDVLSGAAVTVVGFPKEGVTSGSLLAALAGRPSERRADGTAPDWRPAGITSEAPSLGRVVAAMGSSTMPIPAEIQPATESATAPRLLTEVRR